VNLPIAFFLAFGAVGLRIISPETTPASGWRMVSAANTQGMLSGNGDDCQRESSKGESKMSSPECRYDELRACGTKYTLMLRSLAGFPT
jgi:hypothetical protein